MARACLEVFAEGRIELVPGEIAERSGVSRTTIYRWWPTPTHLLREALAFHTRRLDTPDTGSWDGDVRALAEQLATFLSNPVERAHNSIIASGLYPEFNELVLAHFEPIWDAWCRIVERGIERGEVVEGVSPPVVVTLLAAPLLSITVMQRRSPTAREVRQFADLVVRATAKRPPAGDGPGARPDRPSSDGETA